MREAISTWRPTAEEVVAAFAAVPGLRPARSVALLDGAACAAGALALAVGAAPEELCSYLDGAAALIDRHTGRSLDRPYFAGLVDGWDACRHRRYAPSYLAGYDAGQAAWERVVTEEVGR